MKVQGGNKHQTIVRRVQNVPNHQKFDLPGNLATPGQETVQQARRVENDHKENH